MTRFPSCWLFVLCGLLTVVFLLTSSQAQPASEPAPSEQARQTVSLPPAKTTGTMSLEEVLAKRRTMRNFTGEPISQEVLAQLLWSAQGITEPNRGLRTAPSAGATYPLDLYVFTPDGVFRYLPRDHALEILDQQNKLADLAAAAMNQRVVARASAVLVFVSVPERIRRYGPRAELFIHLEAGHAAQNVLLQATALNLKNCAVGAFDPAAVAKLLNLPETQAPIYMVGVSP